MDVFSSDLLQAGRPCKPLYKGTLNSAEGLLICLLNKLIFVCVRPWTRNDREVFSRVPQSWFRQTLHNTVCWELSESVCLSKGTFATAPKSGPPTDLLLVFLCRTTRIQHKPRKHSRVLWEGHL